MLAPALEVQDLVRLSIVRDPQGAVFGAWEAKRLGPDFQTRNKPRFPRWFEHASEDLSGAARFYAALFGWERHEVDFGSGAYVLLAHGGTSVAGVCARPGSAPPRWVTYFQVASCDATCQRVATLQGTVIAPPTAVPGAGRYALASDPQGATFGVLEPEDVEGG